MSTDEFLKFINTIKALYTDKFPKLTKEVLDVWYECLADLDKNALHTALMNYVKTSDYPPTVASLRKEYEAVIQEKRRSEIELRRLYEMTIAFYPCAKDTEDTFKAWSALHDAQTMDKQIDKAKKILNHVCAFVRRCEENCIKTIPSLEVFLKGVDVDELFG